jgi:hypothetical protein
VCFGRRLSRSHLIPDQHISAAAVPIGGRRGPIYRVSYKIDVGDYVIAARGERAASLAVTPSETAM